MKFFTSIKGLFAILMLFIILIKSNVINAQSQLIYVVDQSGDRISRYTANGASAINTASRSTILNLPAPTTALALSKPQGSPATEYFYWLRSGSGTSDAGNDGEVIFFGVALGAPASSITEIGRLDLNGSSNTDLGFVRLGMSENGIAYILAGGGGDVWLASIKPNAVTPNTSLPVADRLQVIDNAVSVVGGTAADFTNGDLAVLTLNGQNTIFALANNGSGATKIFIGTPNGNSTTFTSKWDLVTATTTAPFSAPFTGSVNGVAFDQQGNMLLTSSAGIYFINASTVNSLAPGTVVTNQVLSATGLTDMATNAFPAESPLPVRLTQFNASLHQSVAHINWLTEAESEFSHFELERSIDGVNDFKKISNISSGSSKYQYADDLKNVAGNNFAYRLKMVDQNQSFTYSNIVVVRKSTATIQKATLAPNPVVSKAATLQFESAENADVQIRILDLTGRVMLQQQSKVNTGMNSISVQNLEKLQAGQYIIQIAKDKEINTIKFSVN